MSPVFGGGGGGVEEKEGDDDTVRHKRNGLVSNPNLYCSRLMLKPLIHYPLEMKIPRSKNAETKNSL